MKHLISLLFVCCIFLCGCGEKEEIVSYDLAICDISMTETCDYLNSFESEKFSVMETEVSSEHFDVIINALKASSEGLNSITVYSDKLSDENAKQFIDFVRTKEIPVTFAFSNISTETLISYDKAFCITTNYKHAAEITAERIKYLWAENTIKDADENKIFTFACVKNDNLSENMQIFYDTLIAGIELYGVPMQINSSISPDQIGSGDSLVAFNETNEALIIVDKSASSFIKDYTPYSNGIELIAVTESFQNNLSDCTYALNCFIDFSMYKQAADEIIRNFNNRQYPLIEMSFPYIERTVYIPATV
ncbi:MAG: hypothetical protein IKA10_07835 [Oscillospiraceae bacterium]|nr:hypothetical protein [Oscillospiraceae bacterium]